MRAGKNGSRCGATLVWGLVLLSFASTILGMATVAAAMKQRSDAELSRRMQGREWALGALALPPGHSLQVDGWHIQRDLEHKQQHEGQHEQQHEEQRAWAHDAEGRGWWVSFQGKRILAEGALPDPQGRHIVQKLQHPKSPATP